MRTKRCGVCEKTKPLSAFYKSKRTKDRHAYRCKDCSREEAKRYYAKNKGKYLARARQQPKVDPVRARRYSFVYNLKTLYGITQEQYDVMLTVQRNNCRICKEPFKKTPHIDHCHKTKKVRGLLCGDCNRGLGGFKDKVSVLEAAIAYLKSTF